MQVAANYIAIIESPSSIKYKRAESNCKHAMSRHFSVYLLFACIPLPLPSRETTFFKRFLVFIWYAFFVILFTIVSNG